MVSLNVVIICVVCFVGGFIAGYSLMIDRYVRLYNHFSEYLHKMDNWSDDFTESCKKMYSAIDLLNKAGKLQLNLIEKMANAIDVDLMKIDEEVVAEMKEEEKKAEDNAEDNK